MQLLSYDEILTNICDSFDTLIAPRAIARANTNIIYLSVECFIYLSMMMLIR